MDKRMLKKYPRVGRTVKKRASTKTEKTGNSRKKPEISGNKTGNSRKKTVLKRNKKGQFIKE